jgi:8-oxo-dGTP pyrophosphatase MutT (NUDIX family)/nucleoside 2-deoxyribosyltransferase
MLRELERAGYDGVVFYPEPENGDWSTINLEHSEIAKWEKKGLDMSDLVVFWIDRDIRSGRYGLTTNLEYGEQVASGKTVLGYKDGADKVASLLNRAEFHHAHIINTCKMSDVAQYVKDKIGAGAMRHGGERYIPIELWNKESWQAWLQSQYAVGNELQWAEVKWTFKVGPQKFLFLWVVHVHVWIAAEQRAKTNEVVIGRPDVSTVVLLNGNLQSNNADNIRVVLVREYRSPVHNSESFVYENPGGSSFKEKEDVYVTAAHEVEEETGLIVDPSRIISVGTRQVASTLCSHRSHLFACLLSDEEYDKLESDTVAHGVLEDTERTYIETSTIKDLLERDVIDWAQLGMLYQSIGAIRSKQQ